MHFLIHGHDLKVKIRRALEKYKEKRILNLPFLKGKYKNILGEVNLIKLISSLPISLELSAPVKFIILDKFTIFRMDFNLDRIQNQIMTLSVFFSRSKLRYRNFSLE